VTALHFTVLHYLFGIESFARLQETAQGLESRLVPASIVIAHFTLNVKLCKTWNQVQWNISIILDIISSAKAVFFLECGW